MLYYRRSEKFSADLRSEIWSCGPPTRLWERARGHLHRITASQHHTHTTRPVAHIHNKFYIMNIHFLVRARGYSVDLQISTYTLIRIFFAARIYTYTARRLARNIRSPTHHTDSSPKRACIISTYN